MRVITTEAGYIYRHGRRPRYEAPPTPSASCSLEEEDVFRELLKELHTIQHVPACVCVCVKVKHTQIFFEHTQKNI
jgi:hypothetical protein